MVGKEKIRVVLGMCLFIVFSFTFEACAQEDISRGRNNCEVFLTRSFGGSSEDKCMLVRRRRIFRTKGKQTKSKEEISHLSGTSVDNLGICSQAEVYEYCKKALEKGAKVVNVSLNDLFFVYWVPSSFEKLSERRVFLTMHGTNGNAYRQLLMLLDVAEKEKYAVVSLQWGWPEKGRGENYSYLSPQQGYEMIVQAMDYMIRNYGVAGHISAWNGFSRASTQSAVYAFLDKRGRKYFNFFIGVSGDISPAFNIMDELLRGEYGQSPLKGIHFYLWAGKKDVAPRRGSMADRVKQSKDIIEQLGGIVDVCQIGEEGHGGFYHNSKYQYEAVNIWKSLK